MDSFTDNTAVLRVSFLSGEKKREQAEHQDTCSIRKRGVELHLLRYVKRCKITGSVSISKLVEPG